MIEYRKFRVANIVITQEGNNLIFDGENHAQKPCNVMIAMLKVSNFLNWWKSEKTKATIQNLFVNTEELEWANWKGLDLADLKISNSRLSIDCNFKRNTKTRKIYIGGEEKIQFFKTGNVKFACFNKKDFKPLVNSIIYNHVNAQKLFLTRFSLDVLDFFELEELNVNVGLQNLTRKNFDTGHKLVYKVCNNLINEFDQDIMNLDSSFLEKEKNKLNMQKFDLQNFIDELERKGYETAIENEMKKYPREHFPVAYEVTM